MAGTKSNSGGVRNINAKGFVSFSSSFFKILILYTHTQSHIIALVLSLRSLVLAFCV